MANAVGAFDLYGGPCIVVDLGTATTFDAISAGGEYLGGAITPGVAISLEALFQHAAALRRVEMVEPRDVIGRSTVESIQSGTLYGFAAQVDGLCQRFMVELGPSTVVATGGLCDSSPRTLDHPAHRALADPARAADRLRAQRPRRPPLSGAAMPRLAGPPPTTSRAHDTLLTAVSYPRGRTEARTVSGESGRLGRSSIMMRQVMAGVALGGALALASVGVASAAPTSSSTPTVHPGTCAKAPKALARIAHAESKVAQRLTRLEAREAEAQSAGNATVEHRVDVHITRVQGLQGKLTTRQQKVESVCPGAVAGPATTQS